MKNDDLPPFLRHVLHEGQRQRTPKEQYADHRFMTQRTTLRQYIDELNKAKPPTHPHK